VPKVLKVHHQEHKELKEQEDQVVPQDPKVPKEVLDLKVLKVLKVVEHLVTKVLKEDLVVVDLQAHKVLKDLHQIKDSKIILLNLKMF
jgi:hypothetical protein